MEYSWDLWVLIILSYGFVIGGFTISIIGSIYLIYKELLPGIIKIFKSKIEG